MVNELILRKIEEQNHLIKETLNNFLNKYLESVRELILSYKSSQDSSKAKEADAVQSIYNDYASKIEITNTIRGQQSGKVTSILLLKDKRLVSCSSDFSIIVYNKFYQPQIKIQNAHNGPIWSMCTLRNGELVSSGGDGAIKIWRINSNDYEPIYTLRGHNNHINKVIELKDGKLCSCSDDKTIKIWDDKTYQCIKTLAGHSGVARSIIEINNYIISASPTDRTLKIWDQSTYQCIKTISSVKCSPSSYLLSKIKDTTLFVGGRYEMNVVDIETFKVIHRNKNELFGVIFCFIILRNGLVLIGNEEGEIICYDFSLNQIILKNQFHNEEIYNIIETEDNKLISCSSDQTINIYN